ncbi:MAG: type II toxin-antitoxin system VapC family toxin [Chthoniobacter sp.]|uniref:type II toxin-antitoxin system VapC family toxin n=1 Tax=Chthoniobacter sp. TaxID=2510640 RepID=UPI0032AA718E
MSLPRLYLETTIPSYLTARRSRDLRLAAHQEVTEDWWNDHRHKYDLYTSAFVREEAAEGNPALAAARLALLDNVPVLPTTEEAEDLAGKLLEGELIPAKAATDAFHIATAAVHGMDFLLTWNCTHIHNLSIVRRVERICAAAGYVCPVICNPDELLPPSKP